MVIKFVCPNGHPLSAGEEMAGKPGKCPKCQSMFLVPEPASARSGAGDLAGKSMPDTISFLCPNGHRLSGPRLLQGKAGQCPHCGSRFRIPSYEDLEETPVPKSPSDQGILEGEVVHEPMSEQEVEDLEDVEVVDDDEPAGDSDLVDDVELDESDLIPPPPPPRENLHPLAMLCLRFRGAGNGTIEVAYGENQTLAAEYFSPELSQWDCGVFARRDQSGEYTITAIPWSSIRRLSFAGVANLPPGVFE